MNKMLKLIFILFVFLTSYGVQAFQKIEIITEDNIKIHAVYQLPNTSVNIEPKHPAIILIHQGGSSHKEWLQLDIVEKLLKQGFAILAFDIRIHGQSGKDEGDIYDLFNNPNRAPNDLQAVIQFLKQDKNIDSENIGILGASVGANLAVVASGSDLYKIKSVVSISAKTQAVINLGGNKLLNIPKNAFYIASKMEQNGLRNQWAHELYEKTSGLKKIEIAEGNKHGSYVLAEKPDLQDSIIEWFNFTLKSR